MNSLMAAYDAVAAKSNGLCKASLSINASMILVNGLATDSPFNIITPTVPISTSTSYFDIIPSLTSFYFQGDIISTSNKRDV